VDQVYAYRTRSTALAASDGGEVSLATSGGVVGGRPDAHPYFFDGLLRDSEQAAKALLYVAKVARTRFYRSVSMVSAEVRAGDPVVTSNGDRLRFESFSACCGGYARFDVLSDGLGSAPLDTGTTNVDVNEPLRVALASVIGRDPLHLRVGDDLTVTTKTAAVIEEKVKLPERWLKGFAEVQIAGSAMEEVFRVQVAEARRLLRSLPSSTGAGAPPLWVVASAGGLRLSSRPAPPAVCLGGAERLRDLEPLLRFATGLAVYADVDRPAGEPTTSAWVLELDAARLTVTLSPQTSRGFSGEGGVLSDLADDEVGEDADLVSVLLAFEPRIDTRRLSAEAAIPEERVVRALRRLGAAGRVGYDVADAAYFHRELPYDEAVLVALHPRLRDAQALVTAGAVTRDGDVVLVHGVHGNYQVRRGAQGSTCTCTWYAKHGTGRGPCKHVLAADIACG
jgi:hypothetical protein